MMSHSAGQAHANGDCWPPTCPACAAEEDQAPPTCAWCEEPATDQVHAGTSLTTGRPRRRYTWLCEDCAREAAHEKTWSQRR